MKQMSLRVFFLAVVAVCGVCNLPVMAADDRQNVCLNLVEEHCQGVASTDVMDSCVSSGILSCARPQFCAQPSETGMCRAAFTRFFFNRESGSCQNFIYGGCQGNQNNFASQEECEDACQGLRYCGGNSGASCPDKFDCDSGICVPSSK